MDLDSQLVYPVRRNTAVSDKQGSVDKLQSSKYSVILSAILWSYCDQIWS